MENVELIPANRSWAEWTCVCGHTNSQLFVLHNLPNSFQCDECLLVVTRVEAPKKESNK